MPGSLELALDRPVVLQRALVRDPGGKLLLEERFPAVQRSRLHLALTWPGAGRYGLELAGPWGSLAGQVTVPAGERPGVRSRLWAPYQGDQSAGPAKEAAVAAGGVVSCALVLRQEGPGPSLVRGELTLGPGLELVEDGGRPAEASPRGAGQAKLTLQRELKVPGEDCSLLFRVRSAQEGRREITARVSSQTRGQPPRQTRLRTGLDFKPPAALSRSLEVAGLWLPTGVNGLFDQRKQADTIYYRPPWLHQFSRWLGAGDDRLTYWLPYTYQSLELVNQSRQDLPLVVKTRVTGLRDLVTPLPFQPPDLYCGSLADHAVTAAVNLPPGGRERVVLPLFITAPPRPGHYRRQVVICPLGSNQPLRTLEAPLWLTGPDFTALFFTLGSVVVSLAALGWLAWRFRGLLGGFKVRQVVIIALFGALTFAGVNLPVRVLGSLFYGLLGPLSVLLTGFFSELLYYVLLVALLRLIPRPGVVSLLTLVRYLLAVLITGGFHLTDFLYLGNSIAVKEAALYLAGVTRPKGGFGWSWPEVSLLALVLALGDGLLNAANIYLHMILMRLFFADWYLWLNVVVNGLAYTALGVWLGKSFSDHLVWADE